MALERRIGILTTSILAIVLSTSQLAAQVVGTPGRVVAVDGQDVDLMLFTQELPQPGDSVEIGYELTPGEWVSVGVWRISDVTGDLVQATAMCTVDKPAPGYSALVLSRWQEHAETSQPPPTAAGDPRSNCQATEIAANLQDLASPDSRTRRNAAKTLYRHYRYETVVQDAAEAVLLKGYMESTGDPQHVDALAWLTNILGASGDPRFKSSLAEVMDGTPSRKLYKYARKNQSRLR